jgi:tetratricopeptide (TPR) repeat protein
MYKARINAWNLHKNLKKAQKATLIQKARQRSGVERLLPNGRPLMPRLLRYCRENKVEIQAIEAATSRNQQRRVNPSLGSSSREDAAALEVWSLFRSSSQPSQPIAMYGDMRNAETIIWHTEVYLNLYLTNGPGTLYYQMDPIEAARENSTAQSLVWTRNESAWSCVIDVDIVHYHVCDAMRALKWGFTESAFEEINKACVLLPVLFKEQTPHLLPTLISILVDKAGGDSNFARNVRQFIIDMAAKVLGAAHPISMITNMLCTFSSMADRLYAWRAVADSFGRGFRVVEDSIVTRNICWRYYCGLLNEDLIREAQEYLDVMYSADGDLREQDPEYLTEKASWLYKQGEYVKAGSLCRRCLELLKEAEHDIMVHGRNSTFLGKRSDITHCLYGLAYSLEDTERIDEAKVMFRRTFEFDSAALGPDSVEAVVSGADLDDFLIRHGYLEESATLRAQYPRLLSRNMLPPECL